MHAELVSFSPFVPPVYRLSFDKSYSEMRAPTGEWKYVIGGVCGLLAVAIFFYGLQKKYGKLRNTATGVSCRMKGMREGNPTTGLKLQESSGKHHKPDCRTLGILPTGIL